MAYTTDLVEGLAADLMQAGLGVYRPAGPPYAVTETGIYLSSTPDGPDRAICLTPYPVTDDVVTDTITAVQVRYRAGTDPRQAMAASDAVFERLHNRRGYYLGPVRVAVSWRQSEALLGQDVHGRDERVSNFYFQTTRAFPNAYE